jgi:transketolase N-terminal domain/subunit
MSNLNPLKEKKLQIKAAEIRMSIIDMLEDAGSGHTAGPLDMADVFTAFYFHILNHDSKKPDWPERDRLILSNGHIVPVRYATMAHAGYFPISELRTLRKFGSRLQGHPEREKLPGLENTSGPLGSGLSQAAGYAYAARMDGKKFRTYCFMSDGELDEGNSWEGIMFAGANKLSNLTAVVDIEPDGPHGVCRLGNRHGARLDVGRKRQGNKCFGPSWTIQSGLSSVGYGRQCVRSRVLGFAGECVGARNVDVGVKNYPRA